MWSVGKFQLAVPRKYLTGLMEFMELIPCKADSRSNSPETPHLLWNPEIYFHVHKSFKVVPVLTHIIQSTTCHRMSSISIFLSSPKYPSVFKVVNSFQNVAVLWDVTPCFVAEVYWPSRGIRSLNCQGRCALMISQILHLNVLNYFQSTRLFIPGGSHHKETLISQCLLWSFWPHNVCTIYLVYISFVILFF